MIKRILPLLLVFTLAACGPQQAEGEGALRQMLLGQNIADLTYTDAKGTPLALHKLHNGKPMLVNYWATWCPPCVMELPSLLRLEQQGKFQVVAVSLDTDPAQVQDFLRRKDLTALTVIFDKGGLVTAGRLGVSGVPTTLVLDQELTLQGLEEGGREWDHASTITRIYDDLRHPTERKN